RRRPQHVPQRGHHRDQASADGAGRSTDALRSLGMKLRRGGSIGGDTDEAAPAVLNRGPVAGRTPLGELFVQQGPITPAQLPDEAIAAEVTAKTGLPVKIFVAPADDIRRSIDQLYRALGGLDRLVQAFEATESTRVRTGAQVGIDLEAEDAPVVRVVTLLLTQ